MNGTTLPRKSGPTTTWIVRRQNTWRVAILVLLLVAILGPWSYSADGLPPAEWCHVPNILLENELCVKLVSGASILAFMARVLFSMGPTLASGLINIGEFTRELLFVLLLFLFLLPFLSTLLLLRGRDHRRRYLFHLVAWGLALVAGLLVAVTSWSGQPWRLWGIWLYLALAATALILEIILKTKQNLQDWNDPGKMGTKLG